MDVPDYWEPQAVFAVQGRCVRLEETLTVFHDALVIDRTALFTTEETFDAVASRFDRILGRAGDPFDDDESKRCLEWGSSDEILITLEERLTGDLAVSVSRDDRPTAVALLAVIGSSPLAAIDEQVRAIGTLSGVGSVRKPDEPTRWHLQGTVDDDEREALVNRLVELGFDDSGLENEFVKDDQRFVVGDYYWTAHVPV